MIKKYFKHPHFKQVRWLWLWAIVLLIWQAITNLKASEFLKDNSPTEWDSNGPGYHK